MSRALAELDRLLRAMTPSERRVARLLLPHVFGGPMRSDLPLSETRVTIAIPKGAESLGEQVLAALLALPEVQADALSPEAITVSPLGAEGLRVVVRIADAALVPVAANITLPPNVRAVYDVLVQCDERGLVVSETAARLDLIGYEVSGALQALRRRGMAFCAKEQTTSRWGITQEAADHALALALGQAPKARSAE